MSRGILLCLLVLFASAAQACKFRALPFVENLQQVDVAFVGQVVRGSHARSGQESEKPALFQVSRTIKGTVAKQVEIRSSSTSCGMDFETGQIWLILASGQTLVSDMPSGSLLLVNEHGIRVLDPRAMPKLE